MARRVLPRATTAQRMAANPIMREGEIVYDTDRDEFFGGDGTTVGGVSLFTTTSTISTWSATASYADGAVVTDSTDSLYIAVQPSMNVNPATDSDESHWKRFAFDREATDITLEDLRDVSIHGRETTDSVLADRTSVRTGLLTNLQSISYINRTASGLNDRLNLNWTDSYAAGGGDFNVLFPPLTGNPNESSRTDPFYVRVNDAQTTTDDVYIKVKIYKRYGGTIELDVLDEAPFEQIVANFNPVTDLAATEIVAFVSRLPASDNVAQPRDQLTFVDNHWQNVNPIDNINALTTGTISSDRLPTTVSNNIRHGTALPATAVDGDIFVLTEDQGVNLEGLYFRHGGVWEKDTAVTDGLVTQANADITTRINRGTTLPTVLTTAGPALFQLTAVDGTNAVGNYFSNSSTTTPNWMLVGSGGGGGDSKWEEATGNEVAWPEALPPVNFASVTVAEVSAGMYTFTFTTTAEAQRFFNVFEVVEAGTISLPGILLVGLDANNRFGIGFEASKTIAGSVVTFSDVTVNGTVTGSSLTLNWVALETFEAAIIGQSTLENITPDANGNWTATTTDTTILTSAATVGRILVTVAGVGGRGIYATTVSGNTITATSIRNMDDGGLASTIFDFPANSTIYISRLSGVRDYRQRFILQEDTPSSYSGNAGYQVVVNATGTGLTFIPRVESAAVSTLELAPLGTSRTIAWQNAEYFTVDGFTGLLESGTGSLMGTWTVPTLANNQALVNSSGDMHATIIAQLNAIPSQSFVSGHLYALDIDPTATDADDTSFANANGQNIFFFRPDVTGNLVVGQEFYNDGLGNATLQADASGAMLRLRSYGSTINNDHLETININHLDLSQGGSQGIALNSFTDANPTINARIADGQRLFLKIQDAGATATDNDDTYIEILSASLAGGVMFDRNAKFTVDSEGRAIESNDTRTSLTINTDIGGISDQLYTIVEQAAIALQDQVNNNTNQLRVNEIQDAARDGRITANAQAIAQLSRTPNTTFTQIDGDENTANNQDFNIDQRHRYLEHNWLAHNTQSSDIPMSEPYSTTPSNIQLRTSMATQALSGGLIAELNLAQQRDGNGQLSQIDFEAMSASHSGIYSLRMFRAGTDVAGRPAIYHTNLLPFGSGIDQNSGFEFAQFDRNSQAAAVHVIRVENISTNTVARAYALANGISLGVELGHADYAALVNAIINSSLTRESNGAANALAGDYTFTSNNDDQSHPYFITTSTDNGVAPTIGRIRFVPIGTSNHTPRLADPNNSMVLFQQGVGDTHTDPVQIAFNDSSVVDQSAGELLLFRVTATDHADTVSPGNIASADWLSDYIGDNVVVLPADRRYDIDDYGNATDASVAASDSFSVDSHSINIQPLAINDLSAVNATALTTALASGEVWMPVDGSQLAIVNEGQANETTLVQILDFISTAGRQYLNLNMSQKIHFDGTNSVPSGESFINEIDGTRRLFTRTTPTGGGMGGLTAAQVDVRINTRAAALGDQQFEFARSNTTGAYVLNVLDTPNLTFYRGAFRTGLLVNGAQIFMIRRNVVSGGQVTTTWAGWNGSSVLTLTELRALNFTTNMPTTVTS